ncbi:MAG: type II secretion system secretin GspD [Rhodoferax sp.]
MNPQRTLFTLCCSLLPALAAAELPAAPEAETPVPRILRGNDQVVAKNTAPAPVGGAAAALKFEDAPLADVVGLVLREIARVNYLIHPPINGTVTLSTQGPVSADQAVQLLEAALQANGLQMARDTRGTYHIGKPEVLRGIVPAVRQSGSGPLPPGYGAVVIPLKYMGAAEMASILRPLAPPEAVVRVDTVRNLLVMVGTRTQVEGWLDIVNTFDIDLLKGMSVGVFPLKHVTIKEVEMALRLLSGGSASDGATAKPGAAPTPAPAPAGSGAAATAKTGEVTALGSASPFYGALRVIPIERLNSILVVTPRAAYLDEARQWIEKLDQPGGNSPEPQLFVYAVQNGNAKHLADVLNGLFGGTASSSGGSAGSGVAPSLPKLTSGTAGVGGAGTQISNQAGTSTVQGSGLTTLTLNTGLRVIADEINNAVLVYGTRGEFEKIQATLKQLDVPPTQVLIEASIIEVTLNDDLKYGLQWTFTDAARGSAGLVGTGVLSTATGAVFGTTPAGFSYTLRNSVGDVRAVLNALADKSLVKVISSPSLMVLDNHTASIAVGDQQPVKLGQTVTSVGVSDNIQYKDTGVTLSVTPSVNAGNMVTMLINQAVTDVGQVDVATGQRSFLQRQFASKVAVRSGEALVLGGLIRDNSTTGRSGLPGLQDIPLLGHLFGATTNSNHRTELLVVITPRVVRTEQDMRQASQELKDRMRGLYPNGSETPAAVPLQ